MIKEEDTNKDINEKRIGMLNIHLFFECIEMNVDDELHKSSYIYK